MILEKINKPNDIKKLSPIEYNQLAAEIREFLIQKISVTGGHLAKPLDDEKIKQTISEELRRSNACHE